MWVLVCLVWLSACISSAAIEGNLHAILKLFQMIDRDGNGSVRAVAMCLSLLHST